MASSGYSFQPTKAHDMKQIRRHLLVLDLVLCEQLHGIQSFVGQGFQPRQHQDYGYATGTHHARSLWRRARYLAPCSLCQTPFYVVALESAPPKLSKNGDVFRVKLDSDSLKEALWSKATKARLRRLAWLWFRDRGGLL